MSVAPWADVARVGMGPAGTVSLAEGSTFLISGFPVGDPTTSSAQAWGSASVLLLLRVLLGLEPNGPRRWIGVQPIPPVEALPFQPGSPRPGSRLLSVRVGPDGSLEPTEVPEEALVPHPVGVEGP